MRPRLIAAVAVVALGSSLAVSSPSLTIHAGPAGSTGHDLLCPKLEAHLKLARLPHGCRTSADARESLRQVLSEPRHVGISALDGLAFALAFEKANADRISVIRTDDARECLFFATRAPGVTTWGELVAWAPKLRFVVAGEGTAANAAATLAYLRSLDPTGVGKGGTPTMTRSGEEAVRTALEKDDAVALLVELPDPRSPGLTLVRELGGRIVTVADRTLLGQKLGSHAVYAAEEVEFAAGSWTKSPLKVATLCTPIAIYTGAGERVPAGDLRQEHSDLMAAIATIEKGELSQEAEDRLGRILRRSRELSGTSVEELMRLSEEARRKAMPYVEKAIAAGKQAAREAVEAAGPMIAKAKELTERTKREVMELLEDLMPPHKK